MKIQLIGFNRCYEINHFELLCKMDRYGEFLNNLDEKSNSVAFQADLILHV